MKVTNLHELFLQELRDLYSAESQIIKALPKMIGVASNDKLKEALENHLEETKEQRNRLDTIGEEFDFKVQACCPEFKAKIYAICAKRKLTYLAAQHKLMQQGRR